MRRLAIIALLLLAPAAQARPVLVEMFVSQACSSCPPADALLKQLAAQDKDILPLSLNVTYWNNPGWHDTDATKNTTLRQFYYARLSNNQVYTPEAVVDGKTQLVGSNKAKLTAAIASAKAAMLPPVPLSIKGGAMVSLEVPQGQGAGQIILFGYDSQSQTKITGGENRGSTITEVNVVRSITALGPWNGWDERFTIPHPAGQHLALLLQAQNGTVLGLATQ